MKNRNSSSTNTLPQWLANNWTPDWAKKAIWYQIFPERFCNGDSGNNPDLSEALNHSWQIHPWTSDWYEIQPYEQKNNQPWSHQIFRRRYGGDLQGIFDKLDYLEELGINAIYFNPVFHAFSSHKYDGMCYQHIDAYFGPNPQSDLRMIENECPEDSDLWGWTSADLMMLDLIEELHRRKIRVIFDGVFNHMGNHSYIFQDVIKNQQNSKYRDWFAIKSWDDPDLGTTFDYESWYDHKSLPEFREDGNGIVDGPKQYIFETTRRWMEPVVNDVKREGIDGWRLDAAFCVKPAFWKGWRKLVKSINPEAYLTAEIVEPTTVLVPYLEGDQFDAVMNYDFAYLCSEFFIQKEDRISVSEFDKGLAKVRDSFDDAVNYVQQNLIGSHDTSRVGTMCANPMQGGYREFDDHHEKSRAVNLDYNVIKPNEYQRRIQMLITLMKMTYVGAPMIYYGDEAGMWGANDPCCRKPMVWPELEYEDEKFLPDGSLRDEADKVEFDFELFEYYKKLIQIRHKHESLSLGSFETIISDDRQNVFGFRRIWKDEEVIVLINNSENKSKITLEDYPTCTFRDLLNDVDFKSAADGILTCELQPLWGAILLVNQK